MTLHVKSVHDLYQGNNPTGLSISIRNEYLHYRSVDIMKILYQYSQIAGLPMLYNIKSLNCDVTAM